MRYLRNKETIDKANNFLENYRKEVYNPLGRINVVEEDQEVNINVSELESINNGINTTIKALDVVNDLADKALADIRPVLKKYNRLVTVMQIITVIASGTIVGIVFAKKAVPIVIAILTLTTSIGSYIAKYYMAPLIGGELNRQNIAYKLVELKGKCVGLRLSFATIIVSEQTKEQVQQYIKNSIDIVGEMHSLFDSLK